MGAVWSSDSVTNSPFGNENVSIGMRIDLNCTPLVITGTLKPFLRATSLTHAFVLIAAGLALLYVCLLLLLWRFQEQIVFQPPSGVASADVSARVVRYPAEDGIELFAIIVGDCAGNTPFVIAFHGNA